jgi:hypothetical protein
VSDHRDVASIGEQVKGRRGPFAFTADAVGR